MDDKEFKKEWIHQCLMEFIGLHLTGMDDYFKKCWTEDVEIFRWSYMGYRG